MRQPADGGATIMGSTCCKPATGHLACRKDDHYLLQPIGVGDYDAACWNWCKLQPLTANTATSRRRWWNQRAESCDRHPSMLEKTRTDTAPLHSAPTDAETAATICYNQQPSSIGDDDTACWNRRPPTGKLQPLTKIFATSS